MTMQVQAKLRGAQAVPLTAQGELHKLNPQLLKRQPCRDSSMLSL